MSKPQRQECRDHAEALMADYPDTELASVQVMTLSTRTMRGRSHSLRCHLSWTGTILRAGAVDRWKQRQYQGLRHARYMPNERALNHGMIRVKGSSR
jgi:hypothetical protein